MVKDWVKTSLAPGSRVVKNYLEMQINKGIDLQESEMDTYNNYRGRLSNNVTK